MAVSMDFLAEELEAMKQAGLYGTIRTLEGPQGPWVTIGGRRVLNLCSNNYLGLCNHPRLVDKVKDYVDRYGVGPGAVRTIAGTLSPHLELERKLASFKGAEAAILVQSGFCANLATIPTLAPAAEDPDPAHAWTLPEMVALAKEASGGKHPASMALFPLFTPPPEPTLVQNELEQWMLAARIGDVPVGLVLLGHAEAP